MFGKQLFEEVSSKNQRNHRQTSPAKDMEKKR